VSKVLILGGYGNFGKRIARMLTRQNISVIIAGRDFVKAEKLVLELPASYGSAVAFDIKKELSAQFSILKPTVVINTCGPFQNNDYTVAETCIKQGINYIDLADGREFVTGICTLDTEAKKQNVAAISRASTVPGLTSAVIEHFLPEFSAIDSLKFGIAPGQKAERGLATTQAILSYVGKKLKPCPGYKTRYGWQDLYIQSYPVIGRRLMANCEIPDLDLLPKKYGIKKIQFSAGMENPIVHMGIWLLSWLIRLGLPLKLPNYSATLLKASNWFDSFGSADGGMHIIIDGKDASGKVLNKTWFIIALDGDGPYIPTIPAVILTKKILAGQFITTGAVPCIALVSLEEYLHELSYLKVKTYNI
jgi:hypothetical protein